MVSFWFSCESRAAGLASTAPAPNPTSRQPRVPVDFSWHHPFAASNRNGLLVATAMPAVLLPQWATANREGKERCQRAQLRKARFYKKWLCGAGQGCRGRILERLYIDKCLPFTVESFHQLVFFILSCKPVSYCRFKRIDVYIL